MASSRSVGVLSLFINGDATGLLKEFNKVDRQLARWSNKWTKDGAKLALGFIGVESALKAVSNSVRNVVQNIETIPDVPPTTVASIVTMRDNLASAKTWIDQMTAGIVGFGAQAAQAVGVLAAGLVGDTDTSGLSRQETPDEIAISKDARFNEKVDSARKKLSEARKASELALMSEAKQIVALRAEAERYEKLAQSNSINTVQRLEAQTEAQERLNQANAKMAALNKQLAEAEKDVAEAMTSTYTATLSRSDAIAGLEQRTQRIFYELASTGRDQNDPEAVQRRIDLNKQLTETQKRLGELYKEHAKLGRDVGESIASGFESAVFEAKSLSDAIRSIGEEIMRILFRRMITEPLTDLLMSKDGKGGLLKNIFGGFFADGGRPPLGKVSVVGENGPELFVPDTAGRIIPNDTLRSVGGRTVSSGGGGDAFTFNYSFTGGIAKSELMPLLVLHQRETLAKIADAKRRRTAAGYAL